MLRKVVRVQVPGKLMVAGEYAVTSRSHQAIVAAVDRYIHLTITPARTNVLRMPGWHIPRVTWHRTRAGVSLDNDDPRLRFIQSALVTALRFASEERERIVPMGIVVESGLNDSSGQKYGLGSSAAVTVAIIAGVLGFLLKDDVAVSSNMIFKLAALSHYLTQNTGSGADVAASTYGGLVSYETFDSGWLLHQHALGLPLKQLMALHWPGLAIRRLPLSRNIVWRIGWTGVPIATRSALGLVQRWGVSHPDLFSQFLRQSDNAVAWVTQGLERSQYSDLKHGIQLNRNALKTLASDSQIEIETDRMARGLQIVQTVGGTGKSSGAGGGDCIMGWFPHEPPDGTLIPSWQAWNIQLLDLHIVPDGVLVKI